MTVALSLLELDWFGQDSVDLEDLAPLMHIKDVLVFLNVLRV